MQPHSRNRHAVFFVKKILILRLSIEKLIKMWYNNILDIDGIHDTVDIGINENGDLL